MKKEEIIRELKMEPLVNEGGFVKEVYRGEVKDGRESYGTIYYLLTNDCCSVMHKLDADEIWYYHDGPALEMLLIGEDQDEVVLLGKDVLNGERPQIRVRKGIYQGAHMAHKGEYTLVSTSMSPAYDTKGFTIGTYEELKDKTKHQDLLKKLCGRPQNK